MLTTAIANAARHVDFGIGATFPQTHTDFNNEADTDLAGFLNYRVNTSERVTLGAGAYFLNFSDTDLTDEALYFIGRYDFSTKDNFRFFAILGAGFANISPDDSEDYARLSALMGLGVDSKLSENFRLGLNLNYHHVGKFDNASSEQHVLVPSIFLTYTFGGKKNQDKKVDATTAKKDSDSDGITNDNDQCPKTKAGIEVNSFGCDKNRKNQNISLDVKFLPGKTEIDQDSTAKIDRLAEILKSNKDLVIEIQGHTDTSGKKSSNIWISKKRAAAVRDYLISKHEIDGNRLKAKGYGPEIPIKSNETYEGRKANRRVEAKIISQ